MADRLNGYGMMGVEPDGEFVRYSDFTRLEAENRELRAKLETVRAALQLTAGALQAGQNSMALRVAFTGDWAHLGTRSVSDILDTADAALAICSLKDKDQQNG